MSKYIDRLSPEGYREVLRSVVESQRQHYGNKTKTQIEMSNYLDYLDGKRGIETLMLYEFWDVEDLMILKHHGFIIDLYVRMVDDLNRLRPTATFDETYDC